MTAIADVRELDMSTYRILAREGFVFLEELSDFDLAKFCKIKNIGRKRINSILSAMDVHGIPHRQPGTPEWHWSYL